MRKCFYVAEFDERSGAPRLLPSLYGDKESGIEALKKAAAGEPPKNFILFETVALAHAEVFDPPVIVKEFVG